MHRRQCHEFVKEGWALNIFFYSLQRHIALNNVRILLTKVIGIKQLYGLKAYFFQQCGFRTVET